MSTIEAGWPSGWSSGFASGYQNGFVEGVGALLPTSGVRSFVMAIGDALEADATLAAFLAGDAPTSSGSGSVGGMGWGTGWAAGWSSGWLIGSADPAAATSGAKKVWHLLAPAKIPSPVVTFFVVPGSEKSERVSRWGSLTAGTLQVDAYARSYPEADVAADRAKRVLCEAEEAGTIAWAKGRLMSLWPATTSTPRDPFPAPSAGRTWQESRQFEFLFSQEVL
jgi:hypothetical protein